MVEERIRLPSGGLGRQGRAFLRVAGARTGSNRWVRAFYRAGSVTLSHVAHVLRVLWLEVAGLLFLVLAFVGAAAAVREYRQYASGSGSAGKTALAALFAVLFGYFGVSSFWRSKRKR
jgi:hypothetical protein